MCWPCITRSSRPPQKQVAASHSGEIASRIVRVESSQQGIRPALDIMETLKKRPTDIEPPRSINGFYVDVTRACGF